MTNINMLRELANKIDQRKAIIGVIGLGYVGLPVACMFAHAGFQVIGLDIKTDRIASIQNGVSPIEGNEPGLSKLINEVISLGKLEVTTDYQQLSSADVILIDVETPVNEEHRPHYTALRSASRSLSRVMKRGTLVIVESTTAPGTVDSIVKSLLEEGSHFRVNDDFYLGACPERVMPGKLLVNLQGVSRVCGGGTPDTAKVMTQLYKHIVRADLDTTNIITAELVKTTENAYRDVQIAFANEIALICEVNFANVWDVRALVNKSPYRQMHLPGAGVGGHCIPKDPWLLAHSAEDKVNLRIIPAARAINDSMPFHIANIAINAIRKADILINQCRIGVLGYAYLENSDDTRNSPSKILIDHLIIQGADVRIHDPWVSEYRGDLLKTVQGCDAVIFMVAHQPYLKIDLSLIKDVLRTPILIDGRAIFKANLVRCAGFMYYSLGIGME